MLLFQIQRWSVSEILSSPPLPPPSSHPSLPPSSPPPPSPPYYVCHCPVSTFAPFVLLSFSSQNGLPACPLPLHVVPPIHGLAPPFLVHFSCTLTALISSSEGAYSFWSSPPQHCLFHCCSHVSSYSSKASSEH